MRFWKRTGTRAGQATPTSTPRSPEAAARLARERDEVERAAARRRQDEEEAERDAEQKRAAIEEGERAARAFSAGAPWGGSGELDRFGRGRSVMDRIKEIFGR